MVKVSERAKQPRVTCLDSPIEGIKREKAR
jgi:hypothetical protein